MSDPPVPAGGAHTPCPSSPSHSLIANSKRGPRDLQLISMLCRQERRSYCGRRDSHIWTGPLGVGTAHKPPVKKNGNKKGGETVDQFQQCDGVRAANPMESSPFRRNQTNEKTKEKSNVR